MSMMDIRLALSAKVQAGTAAEREERVFWKLEARVFRGWPGLAAVFQARQ